MPHTVSLKLGPVDLDRLRATLVRAGVGHPETVYAQPFQVLADLEELARQLAAARLSWALEQGARDGLRGLARQADDTLRRPACGTCALAGAVLRVAHATFGEPRPASPLAEQRALLVEVR